MTDIHWHEGTNPEGEPTLHADWPLSNGRTLRLMFELEENEVVNTVLITYGKNYFPTLHRKEGKPTGPGGTEWFAPALTMLSDGLIEIVQRWGFVEVQVGAATDRLMKLYRRYLEPRGFTFDPGTEDLDPVLWKRLDAEVWLDSAHLAR